MTSGKLRQRKFAIALIALAVLLTVITVFGVALSFFPFGIGFISYCDERDTMHPDVPVPINATFVEETIPHDTPNSAIIKRSYLLDSKPGDVAAFYREIASCDVEQTNNELQCYGEAEPFGVYTVLIDYENEQTTDFSIEVRWDRCSLNESISIENR